MSEYGNQERRNGYLTTENTKSTEIGRRNIEARSQELKDSSGARESFESEFS